MASAAELGERTKCEACGTYVMPGRSIGREPEIHWWAEWGPDETCYPTHTPERCRERLGEQEWLEHQADQWLRNRDITPAYSRDLLPVSDCGWRILLDVGSARSPYDRIRDAEWIEFYAVFGGHEVTTRRRVSDMAAISR